MDDVGRIQPAPLAGPEALRRLHDARREGGKKDAFRRALERRGREPEPQEPPPSPAAPRRGPDADTDAGSDASGTGSGLDLLA